MLFKERIYCEFGLDIKKVRLREKLREFLMKPDIYNRNKVTPCIISCPRRSATASYSSTKCASATRSNR